MDIFDEVTEELFLSRSPTLNPQGVSSDIFDVDGKVIKVPETVYKYHRKRNRPMPPKYVPQDWIDRVKASGQRPSDPYFPPEGEKFGDWSIELMPEKEGEKEYEFVDETETEYLNRMGYDTSGAPFGVVRQATWLPDDEFAVQEGGGIERVLRDYYNQPNTPDAKEEDGSPWDFAVTQEPISRRAMYRDPEKNGQMQTVFAPGLQLTDVAAELPEIVGELAAGIGTGLLAPGGPRTKVAAGIAAEGTAAGIMRYIQLHKMRDKGYLSPKYDNDMEMMVQAITTDSLQQGGMVAAFGLGGAAMFDIARRAFDMVGARNISPAIEWDEDVFVKAFDQVMKESDEITETLTAPQILLHSSVEGADEQPASELWQETVKMSSKAGEQYDPIRRKLADQDVIKERTLREQFAGEQTEGLEDVVKLGPEDLRQRGTEFQDEIEKLRKPEIQRLETDVQVYENEAMEAAEEFMFGATEKGQSGVILRNAIETVRGKVDDVLDAKYAAIEKDIQGNPVFDTTDLISFAKKNQKKIERDILPSLAVEDTTIIGDILELGLKKEPGTGKKVSYEQLKRAITNVNGQIKKYDKGAESTPTIGFLKQLKNQLKGMREQLIDPDTPWGKGIIERNPNILKELGDIERRYAKFNDNFTRDLSGKLIRKLKGSGTTYEVGDEAVVKQAIMNDNPQGRKTLRAILNTPEGLEGLTAIRSAIKGLYRKQMQTASGEVNQTRRLTEAEHNAFMRKYGDAMQEWLDPKEFKRFQSAASAAEYAEAQIKGLEKSRKALTQFAWGSDELLDQPEKLFDITFKPKEITRTQNLKSAIDALEPGMRDTFIDRYKGMVYKDFIDKTSEVTKKAGDKVSLDLDPRKVVKYLDEHGDQMKVWYGDDFVKGLNGWGDHIRALLPKGKAALDVAGDAKMKAGLDIVRAYVGIFTRPGRMITAGLRLGKTTKEKKVIDGLLNPQKLRNINARDKFWSDPTTKAVIRELITFYPEQEGGFNIIFQQPQLDPRRSQGYSPDQTGTEEWLELLGPEYFATESEETETAPMPFNTGGPVRLIKMKHGY